MATLTQTWLGLADIYKRQEGKNRAAANIIEVLNDTSQDIMTDWVMMPCNDGTKHTHTIRTGLPKLGWGQLYKGIIQSKSGTQQIDDTTGFVEGLCTVDKRVLDLAGENRAAIRASESEAFLEAMAQELVTSMFYHNPATDAKKPKGLAPRYSEYGTSGAANQVVNGGGAGSDNTSIWMVTWGGHGLCALYPDGTAGGITQEDKGEQRVLDDAGAPYYVEEELIKAHIGFAIKDYRRVVRIANVDMSEVEAGNVDLYGLMRKGYYKMHNRRVNKVRKQENGSHTCIYANTDILEALDALQTNSGSGDNYTRLRPMEIEGKEVPSYRGMPIRECDALLNTEAAVPAAS